MFFFNNIINRFFAKKTEFNKYLYQILGYFPKNLVYYSLAFQHKSLFKENNERLEFLGDAIIDTIVSEELYYKFPDKNEGELSKLRSKIVNRQFLNNLGKKLKLEKHLKLQLNTISIDETSIIGNTFEALMGAIYLDGGLDLAKYFLKEQIFKKYIDWKKIDREIVDFKSKLIQYSQKENIKLNYILLGTEQLNNNTTEFEIAVKMANKTISKAKGTNKKKAEQNASKIALKELKIS